MKVDISNVTVAVVFAILGFYAGDSKVVIPNLGIPEAIELVVSVATLIIASQALNSWRKQFKHQIQYKTLLKVKDSFEEYWKAEDRVWTSFMKKRHLDGFTLDLLETEFNYRNDMQREYQESWDELAVYCPKFVDEYCDIAPDNISRIHLDYINEQLKPNLSSSTSGFDNWQNKIIKRARSGFYTYVKKLG